MSAPRLEDVPDIEFTFSETRRKAPPRDAKPPRGYDDWLCYRDIAKKYDLGFMTVKHMWRFFGNPIVGDDGHTRWFHPDRVDMVMRKRADAKMQAQINRRGYAPAASGPRVPTLEAMRIIQSAMPMVPRPSRVSSAPAARQTSIPAPAPVAIEAESVQPVMPAAPVLSVSEPVVESVADPATSSAVVVMKEALPEKTEEAPEIDAGVIRCCWQDSFDRGADVRTLIVEQLSCTWDEAAELFKRWVYARQEDAVDDLFSGLPEVVPLLERGDIVALNDVIERHFSVDTRTAQQMLASWMTSPAGSPFRRRKAHEAEIKKQAAITSHKLKIEMEAAEKKARRELERDTRALAKSWKESEAESARFDREQAALREKGQKVEADRREARRAEQQARQSKPGPLVGSIQQAYPGLRDALVELWKKRD